MALIKCSECGREISDAAPACPGCGKPAGLRPNPMAGPSPVPAPARKFRFLGGLVILGLLLLFVSRGNEDSSATAPQKVAEPAAPTFATSAAELARAYDANTVAADMRFKGKRFVVTGAVASINTDLFGDPYLTLSGGVNQFMEPHFSFGKGVAQALSALGKGSSVRLICTGNGDIAKTPMSKDCTFAN
jgi:hypothetical protein